MARRFGGMNVLRAALGAATGVAEGLQERERMGEVRRKEQEAAAAAARLEQRQAMAQGMVRKSSAGAMDMPGATPRPPMMEQTIGGEQWVQMETPEQRAHRQKLLEVAMERSATRAAKEADDKEIAALLDAAKKGGRRSDAAAKLAMRSKAAYETLYPDLPKPEQLTALQRMTQQQELANAEAWFNTPETDPSRRSMIARTFDNLRKANPKASSRELIRATYNAVTANEESQYRRAQTGKADRAGANENPLGVLGAAMLPGVDAARFNSDPDYQKWVLSGGRQ